MGSCSFEGEALGLKYGIEPYFRLPLFSEVGVPNRPLLKEEDDENNVVENEIKNEMHQTYKQLAESVIRSTATLRHNSSPPEVTTQFGGALIGFCYENEKYAVAAL